MPLPAQSAESTLPASNYRQYIGEPFFLLSDAAYGSQETAFVRFEAPNPASLAEYNGADIVVYRVPRPIDFLKTQKNMHRVQVSGDYAGEGLSNTLTYLADSWIKKSRMAWQKLFSTDTRRAVTKQVPELSTAPKFGGPSEFANQRQFKPIRGLELVDQFRYPILKAKNIAPPKDVALAGSSSEFIKPAEGNVMIPIGKRAPGLYLVEAMVGNHRATTLVFVANTIAVTKNAAAQMTVWTVDRKQGTPVAGVNVSWTDGTGVLQSGTSDARGLTSFERSSPEQTYVIGVDPAGGAFISENFYYDSEIYNAKLYGVTDRPLYRPGDQVFVKLLGREFRSAQVSNPVAAGEVTVQAIDPNGLPVASQKITLSPQDGADTSFRLPDNAAAGGYELRFTYQGNTYLAAFRVAEYQKPHFEIALVPDKANPKTGEAIKGQLQLSYPDGKPVRNASVQLSVRAQQLTMVEGELDYSGQFPVKLSTENFTSDSSGIVKYDLPAATQPSRYVLTAFATDGAAYRVKVTRELLIERSNSAYSMHADRQFSTPKEKVSFKLTAIGDARLKPATWETLRLENRVRAQGKMDSPAGLDISFAEPGSYTITVKDAEGNIVAASSHWVSGEGMKAPTGSIEIVFNKELYAPGETAEALVTFPEPVEQALFTLERDQVENTALMTAGDTWVKAVKVTPTQWRAQIPVTEKHGPNITFSVAYARNGQYVFENHGLRVVLPKIDLVVKGAKDLYAPGEKVTLDVSATLGGKPVAANIALGVVDEMIYVLQPEIAPNIFDFFYHPRRNNVRTTSSLSFISYDLASGRNGKMPKRTDVNERNVKVLERPRRDDVDTALWQPTLKTDANGKASVSFTMPDALTRWRITARAIDAQGVVGQKVSYVRSDKSFYVKWTSPDWLRQGDAPIASVALFNQTQSEQAVEFSASGGIDKTEKLTLKPGVNFLPVAMSALNPAKPVTLAIRQNGKVLDLFETAVRQLPLQWRSQRSLALELKTLDNPLSLPADAAKLQVQFVSSAASQFSRLIDDLIEYPYGCVEQTASRMIPLSLALQSLTPDQARLAPRLSQQLHTQRIRLAFMAGPKATFGWWGAATADDPLLTAYAYYADWRAAQVLQIELPAEHWQRLLTVYSEKAQTLPASQRALMLWMMQEIGLPLDSLALKFVEQLPQLKADGAAVPVRNSLLLTAPESEEGTAFAIVLGTHVASRTRATVPAAALQARSAAIEVLRKSNSPMSQALLMLSKNAPVDQAERILSTVRADMPTLDRALTLVWVNSALGGRVQERTPLVGLAGPWRAATSASGQSIYRLPAQAAIPASLKIDALPARSTTAIVQYESASKEAHGLPLALKRNLYRVVKGSGGTTFSLEPVALGTAFKTDELYLDELVLTPEKNQSLRFGIVEAALPPGASVEATTWGIKFQVPGVKDPQALERARHEATPYGYAVPVDPLAGEVKLRHLVRFAQKGRYVLPPARYYRMYEPELKAFEAPAKPWAAVEVQ